MKKPLKRVFCLLLALVLFVSMPLDLHANAVAVELGWVTWALVSYLTAVGFTFTVAGGIQALQSEVEEKVDTYYQVTGVDLFGIIAQSLRLKPSNNGNGNGFWFGAAAVVAITEFITWVRENSWFGGQETSTELRNVVLNASPQIAKPTILEENIPIGRKYNILTYGNIIPATDNSIYPTGQENNLYIFGTGGVTLAKISWTNKDSGNVIVGWSVYDLDGNRLDAGNSYITINDNYAGFTIVCFNDPDLANSVGLAQVANDGSITRYSTIPPFFSLGQYGAFKINIYTDSIITSPSEVSEFDIEEDQAVEIDFSIFEDTSTKETPEELAEAVKEQIIEQGTVPDTVVDVVTQTQPDPEPTPVPTPAPSPVYPDVDGLGLPSLGTALSNKFPFSLPKDIKRVADILNSERITPVWEVDLYETLGNRVPFIGDTTLRIDLSEYEALGYITRWASVITFAIFLILITKGLIRW